MEESSNYLMEKKIEYLIDMKVGKLKNELIETQNQLKSVLAEMDVMKNKIQRLNTPQAAPMPQPVIQQASQKLEEPAQIAAAPAQPAQKSQTATGPASRTGNFKPGDRQVSIESMFYFGHK